MPWAAVADVPGFQELVTGTTMSRERQATPAMPRPSLPRAAMMPATAVPCLLARLRRNRRDGRRSREVVQGREFRVENGRQPLDSRLSTLDYIDRLGFVAPATKSEE